MTTLVSVIGSAAGPALTRAAKTADNVSYEAFDELPSDVVGRTEAIQTLWQRAARHGSVFTAVPLDPLEVVVDHWGRRLTGDTHQLDLAVGLVTDRSSPDFWIVSDELSEPLVHWYLHHLSGLMPGRVLVTEMTPSALLTTIGSLPYAPRGPALKHLAASALDYVPPASLAPATTTRPTAGEVAAPQRHLHRMDAASSSATA